MKRGPGRTALIAALVCLVAGVGGWFLLAPRDPMERAESAYAARDWNAAEALAREAFRRSTRDAAALRMLARTAARLDRDDEARRLFGQIPPDTIQAEDLFLIARTTERRGDEGAALRVYERAREKDERHADTLKALGDLCLKLDFPEEAARIGRDWRAAGGDEVAAAWLSGRASEAIGDFQGASDAYKLVLDRDPEGKALGFDPTDVRRRRAVAELRLGRPRAAAELPGRDAFSRWLVARARLQMGDAAGAKEGAEYRDAHPTEPEPAPFVGSARCASCHPGEAKSHAASHHARTFAREKEIPAWIGVEPALTDPTDKRVVHRVRTEGANVKVEARSGETTVEALAIYALGSGNRGRSMIVRDSTGQSREYRLTRYAKAGWDLTMHHPEIPPKLVDALGQPIVEDTVRACVGCHTTDRFAFETPGSPLANEHGVGCEKCHGPGGNHVKAAELKLEDLAVVRSHLAEAPERVAVCSQCHKAPRGASPTAKESVRFPWPKLGESRCFTESGGELDCVSCHDPHRDAAGSAAFYEAKCLACHGGRPLRSTGKTPPDCKIGSRSDCLKCHMPTVRDAVPHTSFTDHWIRTRLD